MNRRPLLLGLFVTLQAVWVTGARAVDYSWIDPNGGFFGDPLNWSPYNPFGAIPFIGPGGASDTVQFALGTTPATRYTVSSVSGTNDRMLVETGALGLHFTGDYTLTNVVAGVPDFVIGAANGNVADVILTGQNGATFTSKRTYIGEEAGSSGTVTVTGPDWVWDVDHQVMVGRNGVGVMSIENGADVTSFSPHIGTFGTANGSVTVTGAGSTWVSGGRLSVAVLGTGNLLIENGGSVISDDSSLGNSLGGVGTVTVRDAGSTWEYGIRMFLGYGGEGILTIENNADVSGDDMWLGGWGDEGFGSGTVTVTGAGSTLTITPSCGLCLGNMTVGGSGPGILNVEDGALVSNQDGWIGFNDSGEGTVNVSGTRARWSNAGQLFVGNVGMGTLNIDAAGKVTSMDGWIGRSPGSSGKVEVDGADSQWNIDGSLTVGSAGGGSLKISGSGAVSNDEVWLGLLSTGSGDAVVTGNGSVWSIAGRLRVGYSGNGNLLINAAGTVTNTDADIGATFLSFGDATVAGNDSTWINQGTLSIGAAGTGSLTINSGGHVQSVDGVIGDRGVVNVNSNSVWDVGGSLDIEVEAQSGTLAIGIRSLSQFGVVNVAGEATLGGTLDITLIGSYLPSVGDSFAILAAGLGVNGTFDQVGLPVIPGIGLCVVYNPNSVVITTELMGDLAGDGFVGIGDLNIVLGNWNQQVDAGVWGFGDASGDGFVGIGDLNEVLGNWNAGTPPGNVLANIPEPASMALLTLPGTLTVTGRIRR